MNIRVALVSAPVSFSDRYGSFVGAASTEPSFGLLSLASVAQKAGAESKIIEASSLNMTIEETCQRVIEFEPHVVGISATTVGICAAGELASRLKSNRCGTVIIIGGCHVTALPSETLDEFKDFDLAVLGEGELTLVEILNHLAKDATVPSGIAGTAERSGSHIKVNSPRNLIEDLDSLPLPAWSLLPGFPKGFHPSPARIRRWPCASVVLTRGCPNSCTFCDRSVFGNCCRGYSPSYAITMLKDLRYNFGVKEILIEDDTFIIKRKKVIEFCEILIADKIDITWSCMGRADRVDRELLSLMKKAGCWHISFGIESGDPNILKTVNKNLDINQITNAVIWAKEAGLQTKGFFMIGFPHESQGSLEASEALACSLPLNDISIMQLTPFPGCDLFNTAEKNGTFNKDWRKMNLLNSVYTPKGFSKRQLEEARTHFLKAFYLRPHIIADKVRAIATNPKLFGSMFHSLLTLLKVIK